MLQNHLLYFPERATVAEMASGPLRAWPAPDAFRGLVAEPAGPARGTAIVFHGNAGHAGHRAFFAAILAPLGLRVLLAEYPGYGPRKGRLGEQHLVDDAERTIALAHREFGEPALVIGESLGAAVAAAAAARRHAEVRALMLITPWDRLTHVATLHYPWLPVQWLLRDPYDSVARLASFPHPVLVAVAELDRIVPASLGIALFESLQAPKRLERIAGAEHNDWITRVDQAWWQDGLSFLLGPRTTHR